MYSRGGKDDYNIYTLAVKNITANHSWNGIQKVHLFPLKIRFLFM